MTTTQIGQTTAIARTCKGQTILIAVWNWFSLQFENPRMAQSRRFRRKALEELCRLVRRNGRAAVAP